MSDFYKKMYNFNKVKDYVEAESPLVIFNSNNNVTTSNKTYNEILTALSNNRKISGIYKDAQNNVNYLTSIIGELTGDGPISFSAVRADDNNYIVVFTVQIKPDNTCKVIASSYQPQ